ncbi:MAG: hypothetical protein QM572_14820, partial [Nocardioides sp.]|uniref:hypothetical protein n=1 Tax=Nocardioides sp. TaxID=35761 RepID=UPI0039E6B482
GALGAQAVEASRTALEVRSALAFLDAADEAISFAGPAAEVAAGVAGRTWLLTPGSGNLQASGRLLAATEGDAGVTAAAPSPVTGSPRDLADLMRRLGAVNRLPDGVIEVQTLTDPSGGRRHIVYAPGTDSFAPWSRAVRGLPGNLGIRFGEATTYERGILRAMAASGIRSGEPVLMVGHSQGGMAAVEVARLRTPYAITDVVTAGSPIGDRDLPAGTRLLALENDGDLVPRLDGARHTDGPGRTTVTFDDGLTDPLASHGVEHYVHGAEAAGASPDPAIRDALAALEPFLGEAESTSQTWTVTRE